jgi:hypothetical protein
MFQLAIIFINVYFAFNLNTIVCSYFNPYTVNIRTGEIRKIFTNKRFDQLVFDGNLTLRFGYELRGDNSECYWMYNSRAPMNRTTSWTVGVFTQLFNSFLRPSDVTVRRLPHLNSVQTVL